MTVSAREVRRKVFGENTVLLHNFVHEPTHHTTYEPPPALPPAEAPEVSIDPDLLAKFAQEFTDQVQVHYAEAEYDEDEPPVASIFEIAAGVKLVALVNDRGELYWTPRKIAKAVKQGAFDQPLKVELLRNKRRFAELAIAWTDVSTVALVCVSH